MIVVLPPMVFLSDPQLGTVRLPVGRRCETVSQGFFLYGFTCFFVLVIDRFAVWQQLRPPIGDAAPLSPWR